jgi:hypothetical protein
MMSERSSRIARESKTVVVMIMLYCKAHHHSSPLCAECADLSDYAQERLQKCLFQDGKTTCAKCPVHCYHPSMRDKIRVIMRYSGPRMAYRHPVLTLFHLADGLRKEPFKAEQ